MMRNLTKATLAVLVLCLLSAPATAAEAKEAAALEAARAWLAVVDGENYDESWQRSAGYFRSLIGKAEWRQAMEGVRRPLGALRSRHLKNKTYATQLPGVPDGEYVVIQFDSVFEHKKTTVETVTPMLDDDGTWRVAGYYIN